MENYVRRKQLEDLGAAMRRLLPQRMQSGAGNAKVTEEAQAVKKAAALIHGTGRGIALAIALEVQSNLKDAQRSMLDLLSSRSSVRFSSVDEGSGRFKAHG